MKPCYPTAVLYYEGNMNSEGDNENFSRFSCMYSKRHVFSMLNRECAYRVVKTLFEYVYYVHSMVRVLKFTIHKKEIPITS